MARQIRRPKNRTVYQVHDSFSKRQEELSEYLRLAQNSELPRNRKKFGSLKSIAYQLRDETKAETYERLLSELFALACRFGGLENMRETVRSHGSDELFAFVKKMKKKADTTRMMTMSLINGSVAVNYSEKNLANIGLAKSDLYFAHWGKEDEGGACLMTKRDWSFAEDFNPDGWERVHPNLFMSKAWQPFNVHMIESALAAIIKEAK